MTSDTLMVRALARMLARHATMHTRDGSWYCGGCDVRLGTATVDLIDDTATDRPGDLLAHHQALRAVQIMTSHTAQKGT